MTSKTKVYLVGGPDAQKDNSYLMMTNSVEEAVKFLETVPNGQIKTIEVGGDK